MTTKEKSYESFKDMIYKNKKSVNYMFLGVGLALFVLNISSLISFVQGGYPYTLFDISTFGSILITIIAVYNIYE